MTQISVVMAVYNGRAFLNKQLESVLIGLTPGDELIVIDDASTDGSLALLNDIVNPLVKVYSNPVNLGVVKSFERGLQMVSNEIVFLSDQDDVWLPDKVSVMCKYLQYVDLVVSDCKVVDINLDILQTSFFAMRNSRSGLFLNLWRNRYLGCCMAFRRELLKYALPFPANIPMHDWWLGLVAEVFGRVAFISMPLILYRRHGGNVSPTSEKSNIGLLIRVRWRVRLIKSLFLRRFDYWLSKKCFMCKPDSK